MVEWIMLYSSPTPLTRKEIGRRLQEAAEQVHRKRINALPAIPGGPCGAKTRAGTPCKQKAVYENGRCKFHGGLSTGPRTPEGKRRSVLNGHLGGRPRKKQSP